MRFKIMFGALAGLLFAGAAVAQEAPATPEPAAKPRFRQVSAIAPALEQENVLNLDLSTGGRVSIQLRPDAAPQHIERIKLLTRQGFYNGVIFHRVIEGFMAQTGDPTGTGQGGSPLPDLEAEFNTLPHVRGTLSMARTNEPNSANSQFFIMLLPRLSLDTNYTALGRVVSGMEHVDAIERGEPPANPSRILRASIGADNVPPMTPAEIAAANQAAQPAPVPEPTLSLPTGADTLQR